jgi:hypothetical protein
MPDISPNAFVSVLVAGIDIASSVRSVEIEDGDRAIDKATIVLDDPVEIASHAFRENATVKIDLGWADQHNVMFEGVIIRPRVESAARQPHVVTLEAYDLSYKLQGPTNTAEFTGTLSSILQRIMTAGSYGIVPGQISPDPDRTYTATAPLRQVNRRDWDFIQDVARLENSRAFVEYNEGASKFYFQPAARLMGQNLGTLQYNCGLSRLLDFRMQRTASAASPALATDSTDPATGNAIQQRPVPPAPEVPTPPSAETVQNATNRGGQQATQLIQATIATAAIDATSQRPTGRVAGLPDSADRAAQAARQDPTRRLGFLGEGRAVGNVALRAKGTVTIEGIPSWAAGDWYLCQVNHRYERVTEQGQVHAGRETHTRATYTTRIRVTR